MALDQTSASGMRCRFTLEVADDDECLPKIYARTALSGRRQTEIQYSWQTEKGTDHNGY